MAKYEFDSKRWCMSMSKAHHARSDFDTASTFRTVAEEIDNLRAQLAESERRRAELVEAMREIAEMKIPYCDADDVAHGMRDIAKAALVGEEGK